MQETSPPFFILDVDGVLTDGSFLFSEHGKAYKIFGPHDHDGLKLLRSLIQVVFVTADATGFSISHKRISHMGYELFLVKEEERYEYLKTHFDLEKSIYMGDGIYDAKILRSSRFGIAPANARMEAKSAASFVTESRGGQGAVLDASLKILEVFFPVHHAKWLTLL